MKPHPDELPPATNFNRAPAPCPECGGPCRWQREVEQYAGRGPANAPPDERGVMTRQCECGFAEEVE